MESLPFGIAIQICTNPHNLQIMLTKGKESDKFGFIIIYGPRNDYRLIFLSKFFAKSKEECLEGLKELLEEASIIAVKARGGRDGLISECYDGSPENFRAVELMDNNTISWILFELEQGRIAATFKTSKNSLQ